MKQKTPYLEALRYMANAKETLVKAKKENGIYKDTKYVQTACGTAYSGVLLSVDEYLKKVQALKYKKCNSIEEYRLRLAKINRSVLYLLNEAYDTLHIAGYYHATPSVHTVQNGLTAAKKIIEFIK